MNAKKKFNIIFVVVLFISISVNVLCGIFYSRKLNESRGLCNEYRERIDSAERTVAELGDTVEQCKSICGELEQSANRNIQTARDAIDCIEEVRTEVYSLESVLGDFSWDDYYSNLDSDIQKMKEESE